MELPGAVSERLRQTNTRAQTERWREYIQTECKLKNYLERKKEKDLEGKGEEK